MMNAMQTIQTLNSTSLMIRYAKAPITAAGRNAMSTPIVNRRASGSLGSASAIFHSRTK